MQKQYAKAICKRTHDDRIGMVTRGTARRIATDGGNLSVYDEPFVRLEGRDSPSNRNLNAKRVPSTSLEPGPSASSEEEDPCLARSRLDFVI